MCHDVEVGMVWEEHLQVDYVGEKPIYGQVDVEDGAEEKRCSLKVLYRGERSSQVQVTEEGIILYSERFSRLFTKT